MTFMRYGNLSIFQDGSSRHVGFSKFGFFEGQARGSTDNTKLL